VQVYSASFIINDFSVTISSPEMIIRNTIAIPTNTSVSPLELCPYKRLNLYLSHSVYVISYPEGLTCNGNDCSGLYLGGSQVTLNLYPETGLTFTGWGGDCSSCGSNTSCSITMDADKTCTATFNTQTFTLTVTKAGTGSGTVTSSPAGINCGTDCSESYNSGTVVTLTATPASGSMFAGWSGACSGSGGCSVTMDSDKSVTAAFNLSTFDYVIDMYDDYVQGLCTWDEVIAAYLAYVAAQMGGI